MQSMLNKFSIIIPAYNEAEAISDTLKKLLAYIKEKRWDVEVIVVNDGSTDNTLETLKRFEQVIVVSHPYNKGYGASVMSGITRASYDWVLMFDADGQHRPDYIDNLLEQSETYDMIIGSRFTGHKGPRWRQPGKRLLHIIAEYLVQHNIPDLNSGMRLVKRSLIMRYFHIFPQDFRFRLPPRSRF